MRLAGTTLVLSATDLSNFLGCRHRTALEMAAARGTRTRPHWDDPLLDILFARGREHEKGYVESLRAHGRTIADFTEIADPETATARTLEAMRSGADTIVQGALRDGCWYGRPDVLQRVATPGAFGAWSYEIVDTKLARDTRAGTILQLGLYSEMLGLAQGVRPELFHVVTPHASHSYRADDYAAYFRQVRAQMEAIAAQDDERVAADHYPEPVELCDICPWYSGCNERRHGDDHLSIVAGISRLQRRELASRGVATLTALARIPLPLAFKPARGAVETYERIREQARLQLESRGRPVPLHELRSCEAGMGLGRLPEPSPGDVFLDLEGDAFAREGGREYLFGVVTIDAAGAPAYRAFWALTDGEERQAFEAVMDLIGQAWTTHPDMHVYHYAPYEPSAFKRLMGRYATREGELDALLRGGRFVDLYGIVRQGVLAGVERYSIKNLEAFYTFARGVPLADASRNLRRMEQALELDDPDAAPPEVRAAVLGYNRDDCLSALRLRNWLEHLRAALEASGTAVPRPVPPPAEPSQEVDERAQRVAALRTRLLEGIPDARGDRTEEQQGRWLLAYLLDWHRREDKAGWWEYYRLRDLPEEDLADEPQALAGLEHVERVTVVANVKTGKPTGSVIDRYRYPAQEMEIRRKDELKLKDGKPFGKVVQVDRVGLTLDVRKGRSCADLHPAAVFAHTYRDPGVLEQSIHRIGEAVAAAGRLSPDDRASDRLASRLLLAEPPRLRSGPFVQSESPAVDFAVQVVRDLDDAVLAIQGPPGSGKTWSGAEMICALIAQGRRVGVTATGHKVIQNLLQKVVQAAKRKGIVVRPGHRMDEPEDAGDGTTPILALGTNEEAVAALESGTVDVLGGTAWLWAREELAGSVDVLFADEAGQMSLANVLAASPAAASIVLLGDPQQLDQPQKGSHPPGVGASALQHLLGPDLTIPPERGIFLPVTWRLAPSLCAFTSELFYEGRLKSKDGLEGQRLAGTDGFDGSGLWLVEVDHDGNRNASMEEVEVVADLVARLTAPGARWVSESGEESRMTGDDVLVVAPYNAQVVRLAERLASTGVQVGTVDKFQGREAPVVIYSMATSRPEDAPRGMDFLYSPNRLNVATSRARCAALLVASPRLFEPECRSPRQMKLANAFCRYRELASRGESAGHRAVRA